jgi:hypothetical protein
MKEIDEDGCSASNSIPWLRVCLTSCNELIAVTQNAEKQHAIQTTEFGCSKCQYLQRPAA